jgi:IS6 family transposase
VRWYLRYPLSYPDLDKIMVERGLTVDHSTIARWILYYAPMRVAGKCTYLYRADDSAGNTIDFLLSPNRDLIAAKGEPGLNAEKRTRDKTGSILH